MATHFRTPLTPQPQQPAISLQDPLLTVGSCFTNCMGSQLSKYKFDVCANPFGTVFNPSTIHNLLRHSLQATLPAANTYLQRDGIYYNELFHSTFSSPRQEALEAHISQVLQEVNQRLHTAKWLVITLGTAVTYRSKKTGNIVTNCHKQPASTFDQALLSVDEIVKDFTSLWQQLKKCNPGLNIILTVSPVRHSKDSLPANAVSKSTLRLACHQLTASLDNVTYFPAYEIMMDDLRDYRFYKEDLVHPNKVGEEYIWDFFCKSHLDTEANQFITAWQKIDNALHHRPLHPHTSQHQAFLRATLQQLDQLTEKYHVDITLEATQLKQQLQNG